MAVLLLDSFCVRWLFSVFLHDELAQVFVFSVGEGGFCREDVSGAFVVGDDGPVFEYGFAEFFSVWVVCCGEHEWPVFCCCCSLFFQCFCSGGL